MWAGVDHIACQIPHVNVGRASACVREPSSKSGFLGVGISRCENSPQQQPKAPLPRCPQRMMCVSGSRLACAARLLVCSMAWVGLSNTSFHGWHGQDQIPCLSRLRRPHACLVAQHTVHSALEAKQGPRSTYRHLQQTAQRRRRAGWFGSCRLARCLPSAPAAAAEMRSSSRGTRRWHPASPWEDEETDRMRFPCQGLTRSESRSGNARRQRATDACLVTDSSGPDNDDTPLPRSQQSDPIRREGRPRIEVDTAWEMA